MNIHEHYSIQNLKLKSKALPCVLSSPCQNGATCTNNNLGGYTCACATGYMGTNCQYGKLILWVLYPDYFNKF